MKKIIVVLLILQSIICLSSLVETPSPLEFHVKATHHEKTKLVIMAVGDLDNEMKELLSVIKKDLEFSGQCAISLLSCKKMSAKKELTALAEQGYSLVLCINNASSKGFMGLGHSEKAYEWRLYDAADAQMIKGKKYHAKGSLVRGWGHHIADAVWPDIMGQDGFFSTKIAYCKESKTKNGRPIKHIYMADYDGSNEQCVVATPTINVAPRFNHDYEKPIIFYSESTKSNIRMMLVDMKKQRKIASNFDGINMLPSFTSDGSKLVYCASHGHGNCQLYFYEKGQFSQITHNNGNNISPSLSDDGKRLYYCSDYQGKPQIYCYDMETKLHTNITQCKESCFSPSYHSKKGQLAYAKMVKGLMQLFVYDEKKGMHRQLTFDAGCKDECSWSPCGNYLLYSIEQPKEGAICMLNMMTNEHRTITAKKDVCSYPTWSPLYAQYPVVA